MSDIRHLDSSCCEDVGIRLVSAVAVVLMSIEITGTMSKHSPGSIRWRFVSILGIDVFMGSFSHRCSGRFMHRFSVRHSSISSSLGRCASIYSEVDLGFQSMTIPSLYCGLNAHTPISTNSKIIAIMRYVLASGFATRYVYHLATL